ncbi:MAG: hypothetical protein ACK4PR_05845, partial [Gammaproteobacteria bacterium]
PTNPDVQNNQQPATESSATAEPAKSKNFLHMKAQKYTVGSGVEMRTDSALVEGDTLTFTGDVSLKNITFDLKEKTMIEKEAKLTTKNVKISTKELYLQGEITYTEYLGLISETETDIQHCKIKVSENADTEKPVLATSHEQSNKPTNPDVQNNQQPATESSATAEPAKSKNFLHMKAQKYTVGSGVEMITDGALVEGDTLKFTGDATVKNVAFDLKEKTMIEKDAKLTTTNVLIKANEIENQGEVEYGGFLGLNGKQAVTLKEGSQLKENKEINDSDDAQKKNFLSIETDKFKVEQSALLATNLASVKANSADLGGQLALKNTQMEINGKATIEETAEIKAEHVLIKAKEIENSGTTQYSSYFGLKSESALVMNETAKISFDKENTPTDNNNDQETKNFLDIEGKHLYMKKGAEIQTDAARIKGETVDINSKMDLDNTTITGEQRVVLGRDAELKTKKVLVEGGNVEVHANIDYSDYLGIKAKETLTKSSPSNISVTVNNGENYLEMTGKQGNIQGYTNADNASVTFEKMPDAADLITRTGKHEDFHVSHNLHVSTDDGIHLNKPINRSCGLDIEGHSIDFNTDYQTQQNVLLTSKVGDVYIQKNIAAKNVAVDSAAALYTKQQVLAQEQVQFKAKVSYYNVGGNILGDQVAIEAAEVKNITKNSAGFDKLNPALQNNAGNGGVIGGRQVFVEATEGNVENHGGVMKGTEYLQVIANEDVLNIANVTTKQGKHDVIKEFDPAVMHGGSGEGHDGVGLFVRAGGKFVNEASVVQSQGTNYINAKKGIESKVLHHTYVS